MCCPFALTESIADWDDAMAAAEPLILPADDWNQVDKRLCVY